MSAEGTVGELVGKAEKTLRDAGIPTPRLDAELLIAHLLGIDRPAVIIHGERALTDEEAERFAALVAERAAGRPLAQITGEREFYGLAFQVTPDVLTPRPEKHKARGPGASNYARWFPKLSTRRQLSVTFRCLRFLASKLVPETRTKTVSFSTTVCPERLLALLS